MDKNSILKIITTFFVLLTLSLSLAYSPIIGWEKISFEDMICFNEMDIFGSFLNSLNVDLESSSLSNEDSSKNLHKNTSS